ncbi:hypothetical protein VCHA50O407_170109 [Vibrio chagasii]|nr:hypothetical protein VCHA50O407_170109 [Vibrio chagasii]CAH7266893.1 hypothetical protein VCHA50P424_30033 [Vibrio chagasii]
MYKPSQNKYKSVTYRKVNHIKWLIHSSYYLTLPFLENKKLTLLINRVSFILSFPTIQNKTLLNYI